MLILIKGAAGSGKTTLAGRIVERLGLPPVDWPVDPELLAEAQRYIGEWIDLAAYFRGCRHLDVERVLTVLQLDNLHLWPPSPRWRSGASPEAMLAWRGAVFTELCSRRFLPALLELTSRLIDSAEHAVVEGEALGGSRQDSLLTRMLRGRYVERPMLRVLLQRPASLGPGRPGVPLALVNGRWLRHDELLAALSRRPDGGIDVDPRLGLSWSGEPHAPGLAAPSPPAAAESLEAGRQP